MRNLKVSPRIETLESRIAPASLVTVTFEKGVLTLTGGSEADGFTITALDATVTELKATPGTLFHLEGVADSDTLRLTTPVKSLTATLGGDNDSLTLVGLNIAGDVTVIGGAGNNAVNVDTVAIKGALKITGEAGADTLTVSGNGLTVKKDVTLELGDGDNGVSNATIFQTGKNFTYTGGSGEDGLETTLGSFSVAGNLSVTLGAGDATVGLLATGLLSTFSVGKKFTFDSSGSLPGDEVNLSLLGYVAKVGGDLVLTDGAGDLTVQSSSLGAAGVRGAISIETGAGSSAVNLLLFQISAKSITVDASASSESSFMLGGFAAKFSGGISYTGSAGEDQLTIQGIGGAGGFAGGAFFADLGDGDNSLIAVSFGGFFKSVKVLGGANDDNFTVGALVAKTASIDIQTGGGTDTTQLLFLNSTISGKVSVTNDPGAVQGTVTSAFINTVIGSLDVNLSGDGNSVLFGIGGGPLGVGGVDGLTVKKAIHVVTGGGEDTVNFSGARNVKVGGGIKLELGDGTNQVLGTVANFATKSLNITTGSGTDSVSFGGTGNLGAIALTLGAGENAATFAGGTIPLAIGSLNLTSTSAAGSADNLELARVIVTGKLDAKLGADESEVSIEDSIFKGTFLLDTGAGEDFVEIDVNGLYTGTVLAKAATLLLGADSDTLILGGNGSNSLLTAKAAFTADGGTGVNLLTNTGNVFAKEPGLTGF